MSNCARRHLYPRARYPRARFLNTRPQHLVNARRARPHLDAAAADDTFKIPQGSSLNPQSSSGCGEKEGTLYLFMWRKGLRRREVGELIQIIVLDGSHMRGQVKNKPRLFLFWSIKSVSC